MRPIHICVVVAIVTDTVEVEFNGVMEVMIERKPGLLNHAKWSPSCGDSLRLTRIYLLACG